MTAWVPVAGLDAAQFGPSGSGQNVVIGAREYSYLSPQMQDRFTPINAGWKAGRVFDSSASWLAAIGDEAALSVYDTFGASTIFRRNQELAERLRSGLADIGHQPIDLPRRNRSTLVSVPLGNADPAELVGHWRSGRSTWSTGTGCRTSGGCPCAA